MVEIKRFEGKDLEEAIKKACEYFKREEDELDIKVIEPGSKGFLGLGSKKSIIEVSPKILNEEDLKLFAESVTKKILSYISPNAKVEASKSDGKIVVKLDVGSDAGLVIGKERQNLNALELLVNLIVGKKKMEKVEIKLVVVEVEKQASNKRGINSKIVKPSSNKKGYETSAKRGLGVNQRRQRIRPNSAKKEIRTTKKDIKKEI